MRYSSILTLVTALVCVHFNSHALDYQVNFISTAPTIDGTIDATWSTASPEMTGFVSSTAVGTPSTQQTRVRALWDSQKLYLLFEADDADIIAPATAGDTGFDFTTPQDAAEIILDPAWRQSGTGVSNRSYRICVNPAAGAVTFTEAGIGQTAWNLGANSQAAFSSSGTNWTVELAVAWTELNSILTNSPGPVMAAPGNNSTWGAQFARFHSPGNNASSTKWHPTAGTAVTRPIGTLTFIGGPTAVPVSLPDLTPIYSTGFEAPTFTAGQTVSGIEEWVSANGQTFTTTDTVARTGSQSMQVNAVPATPQTIQSPAPAPGTATHVIQYAVRLPADASTTQYRHVFYVNGAYSDITTKTLTQIWLYNSSSSVGSNTIRVINYLNPDEVTGTDYYFPGLYTLDDWSYITIRTDGLGNTFEVWYNDVKLVYPGTTGLYKPRSHSLFQYMNRATLYNKTYGTLPFYLDDFTHYSVPDVNAAGDWELFE